MVDVAAASDPVLSPKEEEENLSDTERFELDDFTLISSELAQEVDDGPAEKVDSEDTLPSPPKKEEKKRKGKHKKKVVSEPGDVEVPQDTSIPEASVEVPEKQKKSDRKRLKRTRSDSEEEYDEEEVETHKRRKEKSKHKDEDEDDEDEDEKLERRRRRPDKKREELDNLASIRKAKEKSKDRDKTKDKSKEKEKVRQKDGNVSEGQETSDSEPEDCEVVPVSTFLAEFRPSTTLLVDDTPTLLKRRSKFGESMLSKRPASPTIVPFERPRIKPIVPPPQPPSQLSQLPTEPHSNGFPSNSHSQSQPHSHAPLPLPQSQLHPSLLQPQLQMQQQLQSQLQSQLQPQLQMQSQLQMPWDTFPNDPSDPSGFNHQWELMEQQHSLQQQQQQQIQQMQQQQIQQMMHQQQQQQQQQQAQLAQQTQQPPKKEASVHKSHKDKKHTTTDQEKREKEKRREKEKQREKEKREKEKREKAKREKKHKKDKPQPLDPTTPEYATKRKDFKLKLSETIGVRLKKYLKAGRIASKEDFKHLARKFTHKIMALEDAKAVFVIKPNTEEKINGVIDAYFNRHNSYSRATSDGQPTKEGPTDGPTSASNGHSTTSPGHGDAIKVDV